MEGEERGRGTHPKRWGQKTRDKERERREREKKKRVKRRIKIKGFIKGVKDFEKFLLGQCLKK